MNDVTDKTATLLAALWVRNRPVVEERLATLERAADADGALDEALRSEAVSCAHKLAGSLGMYGYDEGTRIARELEALLSGAALDARRLRTLVGELRAAVFQAE